MSVFKLPISAACMLLLPFIALHAQESRDDYEHYTAADGLPTQTTYNLVQDDHGFVWIATDAGISRFDGKSFVNYTTENGLSDNEVIDLYEDARGRLWFIPFGNKAGYYFNDRFYNEGNDALLKKLSAIGVFYSPVETPAGDLYGIIRSRPRTVLKINKDDSPTAIDLSAYMDKLDVVRALYRCMDGKTIYCVTTQNRIFDISGRQPIEIFKPRLVTDAGENDWFPKFNNSSYTLYANNKGIYKLSDTSTELLLPFARIPHCETRYFVAMDKYKNIWVSNFKHNTYFFRYADTGYAEGIPVLKDVFSIPKFDEEDNVWFCTGNMGLYKIPYRKLVDDALASFNDRLVQKNIISILSDKENNLWIGYGNGYLTQVNGSTVVHHNLNFGSRGYNRVLQIQADAQGNIWCATDESCIQLRKTAQHTYGPPQMCRKMDGSNNFVSAKCVAFDHAGVPYLVIPPSVMQIDRSTMRVKQAYPGYDSTTRLYSCFFDVQNRCYVSSISGLLRQEGGRLVNLSINEPRLLARIQHFAQADDSTIFLATYSDGLLAMKNDRVIAGLTRAEGLTGFINRRVYIRHDTLYIATNGGITVATYRNGKFSIVQNIGLLDGLHSIDVNDIAFLGNTLYAATSEGLSALRLPTAKPALVSPPVLTTVSFSVNETPYPLSNVIEFPFTGQRIRIEYIAAVMDKPSLVKYRYRFLGKNDDWLVTSSTQLEFNDLPYGNFGIEIQAKKYNSDWSKSKEIFFTITPPFYATWWFKGILGVGCVICLYILMRYRLTKRFGVQLEQLKQQEAVEKERNRLAADIHDDMGAELTNIVVLSRIMQKTARHNTPLSEMLDKIEKSSNEAINKMNEVIWTLNKANDTLHNLAAYLRRYVTRLYEEYGLQGSIIINENVFSELPVKAEQSRSIFLIIKESLHNVVKHSGADKVDVLVSLGKGPMLVVEIRDNGDGFDTATLSAGNGLQNIRKRAAAMQGTVEIYSRPGAGCIVNVKVPL